MKNLFEVLTKSDNIGVTLFLTDRAGYVLLTRIRPAKPPTNTARALSARPIKPRAKNAG